MLITFHSKAVAQILMLTEHAGILLQAAGKSFDGRIPERGAFTAGQLGAAIRGIEQAIEAAQVNHDADDEDEDKQPVPMARAVGLKARAFPLLDMMRQSQAAGVGVDWEVSRGW